jgi:hypothetical protein
MIHQLRIGPAAGPKGAALVGVLLSMLVITLLGTTAFISSTTELQIGSNYRQSLTAFYSAEAGLQQVLSVYRSDPRLFLWKKSATEMNVPEVEPAAANAGPYKFWIKAIRYDPRPFPAYAEILLCGKEPIHQALTHIRATLYGRAPAGLSDVPPIFKHGIVTAGAFHLSGGGAIRSNLHANRGYSIEPASVIDDLQARNYSLSQSSDPSRTDFRAEVTVPRILDRDFQEWRSLSQRPGQCYLTGPQQLSLSGDQGGRLIFVDGDVTLQGVDLRGLTVVATGTIFLNGSSAPDQAQGVNAAFMAGRDIILDHFQELCGVFWTNGSFIQRGSGNVTGSIICQGDLTRGSGFQFSSRAEILNPYVPQNLSQFEVKVGGWIQM